MSILCLWTVAQYLKDISHWNSTLSVYNGLSWRNRADKGPMIVTGWIYAVLYLLQLYRAEQQNLGNRVVDSPSGLGKAWYYAVMRKMLM